MVQWRSCYTQAPSARSCQERPQGAALSARVTFTACICGAVRRIARMHATACVARVAYLLRSSGCSSGTRCSPGLVAAGRQWAGRPHGCHVGGAHGGGLVGAARRSDDAAFARQLKTLLHADSTWKRAVPAAFTKEGRNRKFARSSGDLLNQACSQRRWR